MSVQQVYKDFVQRLSVIYSEREAANITELVFERVTGFTRLKRVTDKTLTLSSYAQTELEKMLDQLLTHKPVQYVLKEAWFCGRKFVVNDAVLIPRPETEELVELIINNSQAGQPSILDIGTGSGCIPVCVKLKIPQANITTVDISDAALAIAKQNARNHAVDIRFQQLDILDEKQWQHLANYDIIDSNPPYIPENDKTTMAKNVLEHEPHIALFAPGSDPLVFYRKIVAFSLGHLNPNGKLFFEIHEDLADDVGTILSGFDFHFKIHQDMMGKDRMITAWRKIIFDR